MAPGRRLYLDPPLSGSLPNVGAVLRQQVGVQDDRGRAGSVRDGGVLGDHAGARGGGVVGAGLQGAVGCHGRASGRQGAPH